MKERFQASIEELIGCSKVLFVVAWMLFGLCGGYVLYWLCWLITGKVPMPEWMRKGLDELGDSSDMGMM
jgi:hypothetical protein